MSPARLIRPLAFGWALLLGACSEEPPLFIQLPDLPPTVGFLLTFGKLDDPPFSVSSAFDLELGAEAPTSVSARDGDTIVLVALDDGPLAATSAKRRSAPANQHVLELNAEECPSGRLSQPLGDARLRIALPKAARLFAATLDRQRFEPLSTESVAALRNAAVTLPVSSGGCDLVGEDRVHSYHPSRDRLFHEPATVRGRPARPGGGVGDGLALYGVTSIDSNRLVGTSATELLLFERGQDFVDAPTHRRSPAEILGLPMSRPGESDDWTWVQAAFVPAAEGRDAELVAGVISESMVGGERVGIRSALVRVALDSSGLGPARTATTWTGELVDFLVESDGRVTAVYNQSKAERGSARDAFVLRGESAGGPWSMDQISSQISVRKLARSDDRERPHIVGFSLGRLMVGDLTAAPPALRVLATDLTGDADALASLFTADGLFVWVGTDRGLIVRLSTSSPVATPLPFRLPMDAARCGASIDECGWPAGTDRTLSLEHLHEEDALIATFQACEAAIVLRSSDLCPSAVRFPDDREIGDGRGIRRLTPSPDGLLMHEISSRTAEISAR